MSSGNSNGGGGGSIEATEQREQATMTTQEQLAQELTPEQVQQWVAQNIAADVDAVLQQYTNMTAEQRAEVAMITVNEQFQVMNQILPTLTNADQVRSHPTIMIKMRGPSGLTGTASAPKVMAGLDDPSKALMSACMFALLQCPSARALLRVHGFTYTFMQSAEQLEQKRIILG